MTKKSTAPLTNATTTAMTPETAPADGVVPSTTTSGAVDGAWPLLHRLECHAGLSCAPFFVLNPLWLGDDLDTYHQPQHQHLRARIDPHFEYRWLVGCAAAAAASTTAPADGDGSSGAGNAVDNDGDSSDDDEVTVTTNNGGGGANEGDGGCVALYRLKSGSLAYRFRAWPSSLAVRGCLVYGGVTSSGKPRLPAGLQHPVAGRSSRPAKSASRPYSRSGGGGGGGGGGDGGGDGTLHGEDATAIDDHTSVTLLSFCDDKSEFEDGVLCPATNLVRCIGWTDAA